MVSTTITVPTATAGVETTWGGYGNGYGTDYGAQADDGITITTDNNAVITPAPATVGGSGLAPTVSTTSTVPTATVTVPTASAGVETQWGGYGHNYGKSHGTNRDSGITITTFTNNVISTPTATAGDASKPAGVTARVTTTIQPGTVGAGSKAIALAALDGSLHPTVRPPPATDGAAASPLKKSITVTVQPAPATAGDEALQATSNPVHVTVQPTPATAGAATPIPTAVVRNHTTITPPAVAVGDSTVDISHIESTNPIQTMPAAIRGETTDAIVRTHISPSSDVGVELPTTEPEPANHRYREYRDRVEPEFTRSDPPELLSTEPTTVYTPHRQIFLNGTELTVDRDIRVSATEYGYAIADCTLWNVDPEFWASIVSGDDLEIRLGWEESGTETVFRGSVGIKRRRRRDADRAFVVRAMADGHETITDTIGLTFTDLPPHRMVERIIDETDLHRGYISAASERIDGSYTLGSGKELGDWLDRLARKATDAGENGDRWLWYIERGKLYFHPAKEQATSHVPFSSDASLLRATPTGMVGNDQSQQAYDVVLRNEPVIRRGVTTSIGGIDTISPERLFHISSYTHESSTTTGRHHTSATFSPMFKTLDDI